MTRRPFTDIEINAVTALHAQGMACHAIGDKLGRSKGSVIGVVKRLRDKGFKLRDQRGRPRTAEPKPMGEKAILGDVYSVRRAVSAHLQDIHREHGYSKEWLTLDIPPEGVAQSFHATPTGSCMGSSAALCAEC